MNKRICKSNSMFHLDLRILTPTLSTSLLLIIHLTASPKCVYYCCCCCCCCCYILPESSIVIEHLTRTTVLTGVTEASVDLVLTLVAMVTRCALATVLFEADQLTGTAVLTRIGKAHVALGKDLWVTAVCTRKIDRYLSPSSIIWYRPIGVISLAGK